MAYSRSILGGSDENYGRSVLGGSDEDYSRSVLGGSDEDYSRSVLGGSDEDYSRSVLGGSEEYFSRSLLGGSDEVHKIHCEPCKKDGNTVDAVKHCFDCSEYLCAQCFKSHTRFKAFQNHVTNDVDKANPVIIKNTAETVSKSVEALSQLQIDHKSERESSRPTNKESSKNPNRKAELVSIIKVRTSRDKQDPYIWDLTIVHACYFVVTDNKNKSAKVVDTRRKCVISEVQISEAERLECITSVNDEEVAVSVNIQGVWRLLFLSVSTSGIISNTGRTFDIKYDYFGIIHHNDHFYATGTNRIDIFSMSGQMLKQIWNKAFGLLYGIALSNDHNRIYVCGYLSDTVFSVDLEGNIKASYKDQDLKGPEGVTIDSEGCVYICSKGTFCVHQLTADLDKVQVIISGHSGNRCIINRAENRLYVTLCDNLKVFDMKFE